jgi:hypothetical protein
MRIGVFPQGGVAAHHVSVELKGAVGGETPRPAIGILRVDRLAIARAQFLDGELSIQTSSIAASAPRFRRPADL